MSQVYKLVSHESHIKAASYAEIGQARTVRFAVANLDRENKIAKQHHNTVKCRDFFAEVLFGSVKKNDYRIWGFEWKGSKYQIDPDNTGILVSLSDYDEFDNFQKQFGILVDYEKTLSDFVPSELVSLEDNPKTFLILLDKKWLANTFMISYYTLLLRALCWTGLNKIDPFHITEISAGQDKSLWESLKSPVALKVIQNPGLMMLDNDQEMGWPEGTVTSHVHDYGGIKSFVMANEKYVTWKNKNHIAFRKQVA